ncbi:MAG: hypothetical protein Kow0089_23220 [Desulfobulbaceae bacterium]
MRTPLISSLFSLLVLALWCVSGISIAADLPILAEKAKQRPSSGGSVGRVVADAHPILGEMGDISHIKSRPGKSGRSALVLTDVSRKITSKSAIVMDAETGETLYALAPDTPRQPASTIKILTGMIALKSLDTKDWVRVSRRASDMPRSKVYLDPRKSYRANDLINAVLLASANDASVALAEQIAGSEQDFAEMMTLRARLWGAKNTICRTATGLTARGQQSTARDLANIFRHAMQDEEFAERMRRVKLRTSYGKLLRNHNKALWRVKGAEGGKTGYTRAARQTYVGQFSRDEGKIIVAIMGSETMWTDVQNLVEYGFTRKKQIARLRELEKRGDVAMAR